MMAGTTLPTLEFGPVQRQTLVEWCAAENDYNVLHFDDAAAAAAGFPGLPIQGTLRLALLGRLIERWLPSGAVLQSIEVRYRRLAVVGDTLSATGTIASATAESLVLDLRVERQNGEITADGTATVLYASE